MDLLINKNSDKPLYRQVADGIMSLIESEELKEGDKLPPERDFATQYNISRGTIKKAYELLINIGVLETIQGSGTYIASRTLKTGIKLNKAKENIENLIENLSNMGFSLLEIESMFKVSISDKQNISKKVNVAAVDCNLEALRIFEKQMSYLNIKLVHFLLSDVEKFNKAEEVFEDFDIIFTTTTHYNILKNKLTKSYTKGKVIQAVVSPDFETVVGLSALSGLEKGEIGIITESLRFARIVENSLMHLNIELQDRDKLLTVDAHNFEEFINNKKCIIIPPSYAISIDTELNSKLLNFYRDGGKIIIFNYIIEKGSLIYLEEIINKGV